MPFLKKFFQSIGHFFENLFNAAEHAWNKLEPEVQAAFKQGSGILSVINNNIDQTPAFIQDLIVQKFPELNLENIHHGLGEVAKGFNIAIDMNDPDLLTLIQKLQDFLSKQKGSLWAGISHGMASILSIALAPAGTKFAKVSLLIEWVYQTFFRKDKKVVAPAE